MALPIISLFCGCGGFDFGFVQPGFEVILALDLNPIAVRTYNLNLGRHVAEVGDLSQMTGQDIVAFLKQKYPGIAPRGVIGGPPCQFFSHSNVHQKDNDERRELPRHYGRILRTLNEHYGLDFFVFENVSGIRSPKHREDFEAFKALFAEAGFEVAEGVLDPVDFGVAQKRPRVFLVGLNREKYGNSRYLFPTSGRTPFLDVRRVIGDLPPPCFFERGLKREDIPYHPNHWAMQPKSAKFRDGSLKEGQRKSRSFRVLEWNKPSWTVAYGHREVHIHPSGERRLSVYEAMLLQGLPEDYELLGNLSQQITLVSDAIPPQLGTALARSLLDVLNGTARVDGSEGGQVVQLPLLSM
jgi:DNA (cytosine-5)-methyltransferase 1